VDNALLVHVHQGFHGLSNVVTSFYLSKVPLFSQFIEQRTITKLNN
jgi:hypothetical protein